MTIIIIIMTGAAVEIHSGGDSELSSDSQSQYIKLLDELFELILQLSTSLLSKVDDSRQPQTSYIGTIRKSPSHNGKLYDNIIVRSCQEAASS
jgi:hypothetical protein